MALHRIENHQKMPSFVCRAVQDGRGFTLIEFIVVCAVIGILATVAMRGFEEVRIRTRNAVAQNEIRTLEKEIFAYFSERGEFPRNLAVINKQDFLDPWGRPYVYVPTGNPDGDPIGNRISGVPINSDFDLYSKGANGLATESLNDTESEDDIVRAGDGSFTDIAWKYGT